MDFNNLNMENDDGDGNIIDLEDWKIRVNWRENIDFEARGNNDDGKNIIDFKTHKAEVKLEIEKAIEPVVDGGEGMKGSQETLKEAKREANRKSVIEMREDIERQYKSGKIDTDTRDQYYKLIEEVEDKMRKDEE